MKGKILTVEENKGIILGDDGERYEFDLSEFKEKVPPVKGMVVDFETEENRAKNIYLLEAPKPDLITAINMESNIKYFGGLGALFILLSWIPYIGMALYLVGLILLTIAFKKLSDKNPSKKIFKNWLIVLIIGIILSIILGAIFISAIVNQSEALMFLAYLIFVGLGIFTGVYYKKIFMAIYELTGETLFKTAANTFFWGGILTIIFIGGILIFIGWIIATIAFFSMKTK